MICWLTTSRLNDNLSEPKSYHNQIWILVVMPLKIDIKIAYGTIKNIHIHNFSNCIEAK